MIRSLVAFILVVFCLGQAQAVQVSLTPSFRLYPMAGDLGVTLRQEGILYDHRVDKDPLQFGMWQLAVYGDVTGAVELGFNYYPISFVKLEAALGGTYRYFNSTAFNCTLIDCSGFIARNRIGISFLGMTGAAYEWLVIPEYNLVLVSTSQNPLPMGDETEVIIGAPNSDTMDRYQVVAGKKMENQFYGGMIRQAQYRTSGQHNEMQALIYKAVWRDTTFTAGAGRYASDLNVPGIAFFASYEWRWGYSQSLF